MSKFAAAGDRASFDSYLNSQKCTILDDGVSVTVTDPPGIFGTIAGFVFNGVKLWTVREGLDYSK